MNLTFDELANKLATGRGAFTLWVGAGASIALTASCTPTWSSLVKELRKKYAVRYRSSNPDMPLQLERIAEAIGHANFRRELRARLITAIDPAKLNTEVASAQAVIGVRAASVVSFNVEQFTALPFLLGRNGAVNYRTFLERSKYAMFGDPEIGTGIVSPPIYFPHGLLVQANVVMTQSEYDRHKGGFAVSTATHLAIGGDLVILGMSLGDSYLREALLKNRSWIRDIYWIDSTFQFSEWARMARVTCVAVDHARLWSGLADAFESSDGKGNLKKIRVHARATSQKTIADALQSETTYYELAKQRAGELLAIPHYGADEITSMAQFFQDIGHEIPDVLRDDPRCRL
jgi:hypothetical protein